MTAPLRPQRLEQLVGARARERLRAVAIEDRHGSATTYGELWAWSGRIASLLDELGIGPSSFVCLALERSAALAAAMLGVLRTGAAYVPLDPSSPPARNALILDELGAALIADEDAAAWAPAVPGAIALAEARDLPELPPRADLSTEDAAYLAYTSGSTGRPKGVVASHRAVACFLADRHLCSFDPADRSGWLSSPLSDATTFELWKPLVAGGCVVALPPVVEVEADGWGRLIRERRLTVLFMIAGLVGLVSRFEPDAFGSLRTLIFGGEALAPQALRAILEAGPPQRMVLGYGPTETTVFATRFVCSLVDVEHDRPIPLGSLLDRYSAAVVDADLRPVSDGEVGELVIWGGAVASGYHGQPDLTRERFVALLDADGTAYRTGDLVRRTASGDFAFIGRADRQTKIRGYRVEPEEIECAIVALDGIAQAVIERFETGGAAHLACFYTCDEVQAGESERERTPRLRRALASRLPGHMIPARWLMVSRFPVNSIGKVDRRALVELLDP